MKMSKTSLAPVAALAAASVQVADHRAELKFVNPAAGRVTLKHGAIRKLDMEAMTIGYRVADPKLLNGIKPGDHVAFDVEGSNEDYTVTKLMKAK